MNSQQIQNGFTLIEMMIVAIIIVILSAIAIPSYKSYISKVQLSACLLEVKGYSNQVLYVLNDPEVSLSITAPIVGACESITDATNWTAANQQKVIAVAKPPSNARIECDIPNGSPCRILP